MRKIRNHRVTVFTLLMLGLVMSALILRTEARQPGNMPASQGADQVSVGADSIGGVVTSSKGPEAGVWVIAETADYPDKFRKIVVTDDRGRYLIPQMPKANYQVWVRGYGLVDSAHVQAKPGQNLDLTAVIAPDAKAAAQYYPPDYWYSMLKIPPKSAFPIKLPTCPGCGKGFGPPQGYTEITTQAEYLAHGVKRGCGGACHQMGNQATREIEKGLGAFDSSSEAWERRIKSGQTGGQMENAIDHFGHERGIGMFADWSDRIAAGELPPVPPRPQGLERNVVLTVYDFDTETAFIHDIISTNTRRPTDNPYGPIYGTDYSSMQLAVLDPLRNEQSFVNVPLQDENKRKQLVFHHSSQQPLAASPYWGNKLIWDDPINPNAPMMDSKGRVWFDVLNRPPANPAWCKQGSDNPFAKNFPINSSGRHVDYFDPKTGKLGFVDTCFAGQHVMFAEDKDETFYLVMTTSPGGIGWVKTRVFDEAGGDYVKASQKAVGWCPAIIDYNGDGKTGAYTTADQPADPKLDREALATFNGYGKQYSFGYGLATNPADGTIWGTMPGVPGKIFRMDLGSNPPQTCRTEIYEPPFNNPKAPGVEAFWPEGLDFDRDGVAWSALASDDIASFDRRKCKGPLNGPTAVGQHCPEGWTLYRAPGPKFKGTDTTADFFYYNWVDQFNTFGLGANIPIATGTNSDSLVALVPGTKTFVTMRVPYPRGFYTRGLDGRIDDPKAGWKGRGLWAANESRTMWHNEGGKGTPSQLVHFQLRPDPLAK